MEAVVSRCELCIDLLCRKPVSRVGKRETVAINAQEAAKYPGPEMESQKHRNAVLRGGPVFGAVSVLTTPSF